MTRIPEIKTKEELPAGQQFIYGEIVGSRGGLYNPFTFLLHCPEIARRIAYLGHYLRFEIALSEAELELAISTTAWECGCEREYRGHSRRARENGATDEAIAAIESKGPVDGLLPEQGFVIAFTRELVRDKKVSDATLEAAKERYGIPGTLELTSLIGYYTLLAFVFGVAV